MSALRQAPVALSCLTETCLDLLLWRCLHCRPTCRAANSMPGLSAARRLSAMWSILCWLSRSRRGLPGRMTTCMPQREHFTRPQWCCSRVDCSCLTPCPHGPTMHSCRSSSTMHGVIFCLAAPSFLPREAQPSHMPAAAGSLPSRTQDSGLSAEQVSVQVGKGGVFPGAGVGPTWWSSEAYRMRKPASHTTPPTPQAWKRDTAMCWAADSMDRPKRSSKRCMSATAICPVQQQMASRILSVGSKAQPPVTWSNLAESSQAPCQG